MSDQPDYFLDIKGVEADSPLPKGKSHGPRRWLGVHFECCGVYTRIYRNRDGTAYDGFCPKCARRMHIPIGPGGTSSRMFRAL